MCNSITQKGVIHLTLILAQLSFISPPSDRLDVRDGTVILLPRVEEIIDRSQQYDSDKDDGGPIEGRQRDGQDDRERDEYDQVGAVGDGDDIDG